MKKKVYVNIQGQLIAGGAESLFQLVDAINNNGGESIIVWDRKYSNPIPEKYKNYNVKHGLEVEDTSDNWIIYPEVWTEKIYEYKNIKKGIWWLSVDNNHKKFQDFSNSNITHFYQSYYALDYLIGNGSKKNLPLFDYIPDVYTNYEVNKTEKQNIICYNPVKGFEITTKVISLNPNLKFVPIIGLNETQVVDLLKISKIYIDFGHHPGRDRIPRESAILGNCVITNNKGSAGFFNDVVIEEKYKINDIELTKNILPECLENFDKTFDEFSLYRSVIKNQKEQLHNLVKQYFI